MFTTVPLPEKPTITEQEGNRAVFVIERCAPGYGLTLGNAFRRVLLSSLPGAAITRVRIEGVNHEFSTIDYVKENVIQILLNLKAVSFRTHNNEPVRGHLKISGNKTTERVVTAGDFSFPSDVEVVTPDAPIATITDKKGKLEMEVEVEPGLGYVPADQHKVGQKLPIGTIAVDAIFSPLRKVNYHVENMRVGDRTDFNRLTVEIETDGSMTPREAFERAAKILVDHFKEFLSPQDLGAAEEETVEVKSADVEAEVAAAETPEGETTDGDPRRTPVETLGLPARIEGVLRGAGLTDVGAIAGHSEEELLAVEGMGAVSIREVKRAIGKLGVTLRK